MAASRRSNCLNSIKEVDIKLSINVLAWAFPLLHLFYASWLRRKRALFWGGASATKLSVSLGQWNRGLRSVRSKTDEFLGGMRPVSVTQIRLSAHGWLALTLINSSRER